MNHEILLRNLYTYGVRGTAHEQFRSYITGRKLRVKMGSTFSDFSNVSIGVPHGSVLGSLLFLVDINELPKVSPQVRRFLFADDTCITLSDISYEKLINNFNRELSKIGCWFIQNRLSLNNEKTLPISFFKRSTHSESKLKLDEHTFNFVASAKYLGVVLDSRLSFSNHID